MCPVKRSELAGIDSRLLQRNVLARGKNELEGRRKQLGMIEKYSPSAIALVL